MVYLNAKSCKFLLANYFWRDLILDDFQSLCLTEQGKILSAINQPAASKIISVNTFVKDLRLTGLQKLLINNLNHMIDTWSTADEFKSQYTDLWHLNSEWKDDLSQFQTQEEEKSKIRQKKLDAKKKRTSLVKSKNNADNDNSNDNENTKEKQKKRALDNKLSGEPAKKKRRKNGSNKRFPTSGKDDGNMFKNDIQNGQNSILEWLDSLLPASLFVNEQQGKNEVMSKLQAQIAEYFLISQIKAFQTYEMKTNETETDTVTTRRSSTAHMKQELQLANDDSDDADNEEDDQEEQDIDVTGENGSSNLSGSHNSVQSDNKNNESKSNDINIGSPNHNNNKRKSNDAFKFARPARRQPNGLPLVRVQSGPSNVMTSVINSNPMIPPPPSGKPPANSRLSPSAEKQIEKHVANQKKKSNVQSNGSRNKKSENSKSSGNK